ncbi:MAG: hypothetical protein SPE90_01410, partial [Prevotella sp.]|nr:hypothetical protein [Prevotella sp.]
TPGLRLGYIPHGYRPLNGKKRIYKRLHDIAFAPSGRTSSLHHTQGDALGYALAGPSARSLNACKLQVNT